MPLTADPAAPPVLDRAVLDHHTMSNADLQREVLALFFASAQGLVADLKAALANGDAKGWVMAAHAVKGSARGCGLLRLADAAAAAESAGEKGARGLTAERAAALEAELTAAEAEAVRMLGRLDV
ncbi:MAG: Hpt domain-containing protein [Pseudomonadota bacterium]